MGCATANPSREPLISDRPDFTESTATMKRGEVQLEGGDTFEHAASVKTNTIGELLLRIGLAPRAELRIEPGSYTKVTSPDGDASGWVDAAVGTKLRLYEPPNENPSFVPTVSLIVLTSVPTGSAEFRETKLQPEAKLAAEWTLSDRIGVATNFNVSRPRDDENGRYTVFEGSVSFGFELTRRLGAYTEVFGFAPQLSSVGHSRYGNTGLTFSLTPDFQLDLRGGMGFNGVQPDYFVGAGLVHRW
jgi:outer membrane putative beta-barrel porin/alpha-amylase